MPSKPTETKVKTSYEVQIEAAKAAKARRDAVKKAAAATAKAAEDVANVDATTEKK